LPQAHVSGGCLSATKQDSQRLRIKGSHTAIKSGMLAAEARFVALRAGRSADELDATARRSKNRGSSDELYRARNFKQWMSKGLYSGTVMVGVEADPARRKISLDAAPRHADHECSGRSECEPIDYPKADGKLTFDRLSSYSSPIPITRRTQPCPDSQGRDRPVPGTAAMTQAPESRNCRRAGVLLVIGIGDDTEERRSNVSFPSAFG